MQFRPKFHKTTLVLIFTILIDDTPFVVANFSWNDLQLGP